MKHILQSLLLTLSLLFVGIGDVWGENTVTYTITSTSAVSTSGIAPTGSSATFNNTYSTKNQLTKGNKATLTLSGFYNQKITRITLNMKSNSSAGAGYLSMVAGNESLVSIGSSSSGVAFDSNNWNGSYTTSYTNVTPTMTNDSYVIQSGEKVVIVIGATTNSLYIQSYTLTYEDASKPTYTVKWHVNGKEYTSGEPTGTVTEGEKVAILPTEPTCQHETSNTFIGWTTIPIDGSTETAPEDLFNSPSNSPQITNATNFYAVFAEKVGQSGTATLNVNKATSNASFMELQDEQGNIWSCLASIENHNSKSFITINSNDQYIKSPEFPGIVSSISFLEYNNANYSRDALFCSSEKGEGNPNPDIHTQSLEPSSIGKNYTIDVLSKEIRSFYIYAQAAIGLSNIEVKYKEAYKNYITNWDLPKHNVSWSFNGSIVQTEEYEEGEPIVFPDSKNFKAPDGYVTMGWTDDEIEGKQQIAPTYVASGSMGYNNLTYYAVFAVATGSENSFVKASPSDLIDGQKIIISCGTAAMTANATNSGTGNYLNDATISTTTKIQPSETVLRNAVWTINTDGEYYLIKHNESYLFATTSGYLKCDSTTDKWTISRINNYYTFESLTSSKGIQFNNGAFKVNTLNTTSDFQMNIYVPEITYTDYCTLTTGKYIVTIEGTEHGKIEVFKGEEPVASGDKVDDKTELTLKVTPDTGYELVGITANGNNISTTNYTINGSDVVFSATFKARNLCTVTWYINGTCTYENYYEGDPIRFVAPTELPESYVFMGWTDLPIENPNVQQTAPAYIKEVTAAAGSQIFYAVFARRTNDVGTAVTYTLNNPDKGYQGYQTGTEADDKGRIWSFNAFRGQHTSQDESSTYYQLSADIKNDNYTYISTPAFDGAVTNIAFKSSNPGHAEGEDRCILISSNMLTPNTIGEKLNMTSGDLANTIIRAEESFVEHSIDLNGVCNQIYIYSSAMLSSSAVIGLRDITVTVNGASYSDYCTLVSDGSKQLYTVTIREPEGNGTITVKVGSVEILDGTQVEDATELKVIATPESDDYKIESLIAIDNEGEHRLVSGNNYTINGSDVTFSVSFREKQKCKITFIMNGNDIESDKVQETVQKEGDYMLVPDVPSYRDKVHFGWVKEEINNPSEYPTLVNINNKSRVSDDATYYAVYATRKENANTTGTSVNKDNFVDGNYYIIDTYQAKDGPLNYYAMTGAPNNNKVTATIITDAITQNANSISIDEGNNVIDALMVYNITKNSDDNGYTIKNVAHDKRVAASAFNNSLNTSNERLWGLKWDELGFRATFLNSYDSKDACLMLMATIWDSNLQEQSAENAQMFKDYLVSHRNEIEPKSACYGSGYLYLVPARYIYLDFITKFEDVDITISAYEYTTYSSNKAYKMPEGLTGRTVYSKKRTDAGYNLYVPETYPAGSLVPVGESLVLQGTANETYTLLQWGVPDEPKVKGTENCLYGEYGEKEENGYLTTFDKENSNQYYYYKLTTKTVNGTKNLGWYWGVEDGKPFYMSRNDRAYLVLPKEVGNNIKAWIYDIEDDNIETTLETIGIDEKLELYDLSGRRIVQKPKRGVYIMDGKKYLVK